MLILPWLAEATKFRHELQLEERARLLFAKQRQLSTNEGEWLRLGMNIIQISTEIIMGFARWVSETPYQNQPFATLF